MLGGTHQFHNTSAVEGKHRGCIQLAGTRVRKYNDPNMTEESMLDYNLDIALFDDIALMVEEKGVSLEMIIIPQNTNPKTSFKTCTQTTFSIHTFKIYPHITISNH